MKAALALLLVAMSGLARAADCPPHLFVVERSKNANVVAYDAQLDPSGAFAAKPVVAYWLLDGDASRREELTTIEWNRAYGFNMKPAAEPGTYALQFRAGKKRGLTIRVENGCPVAIGKIQGHPAILRRIFVRSKEGGLMPSVEYVEFFGEDPSTGQPVHERFVPK